MKIKTLILSLILSSCSSFKASLLSGATAGGLLGGLAGGMLSPDKESKPANTLVFGGLGALIGLGAGYLIHLADPENRDQPPMILNPENKIDPPEKPTELGPGLLGLPPELGQVRPEFKLIPSKKYEVPEEKLPPELSDKVKKQFILEYEVQGQTIQLGNRTIEIAPFKAWEHVYEE